MFAKTLVAANFLFVIALSTAGQAAKVGEQAPNFMAQDSLGKTHKLEDYKGKYVVLEWHNQHCPYVKKHYDSGNMQKLQTLWTSKGVVWLTVNSSAPGTEGFTDAKAANEDVKVHHAAPTAVLLDPKGELGHHFGAKTTPHMFIINPDGRLIYNGAIDDQPDVGKAEVNDAHNYVTETLNAVMAGKPVVHPSTASYGCSVKYAPQ